MSKYLIFSILFLFLAHVLISDALSNEVYSAPIILAKTGETSAFNLPAGATLDNVTAQINDRLDVAFKIYLHGSSEQQAVWSIISHTDNGLDFRLGQLIAVAPEGQTISDVDLNNKGEMVFSFFDEEASEGLYFYNEISKLKKVMDRKDLNLKYMSSSKINDVSEIYFKGIYDNAPSVFYFLDKARSAPPQTVVSEGSGISYLFTLGLQDETSELAFKARMGQLNEIEENRPDQIIQYSKNGMIVVAMDRDAKSDSPFLSFSNGVVSGPGKTVVFVAQTEKGEGIYLHHPRYGTVPLIHEGELNLKSILQFTPVVRQAANTFEVFFRGVNDQDLEVTYFLQRDLVTGQRVLRELLLQNQKIKTDAGELAVKFFSGGLGLNNLGDLVVHIIFSNGQEGIVLLNRLQE